MPQIKKICHTKFFFLSFDVESTAWLGCLYKFQPTPYTERRNKSWHVLRARISPELADASVTMPVCEHIRNEKDTLPSKKKKKKKEPNSFRPILATSHLLCLALLFLPAASSAKISRASISRLNRRARKEFKDPNAVCMVFLPPSRWQRAIITRRYPFPHVPRADTRARVSSSGGTKRESLASAVIHSLVFSSTVKSSLKRRRTRRFSPPTAPLER